MDKKLKFRTYITKDNVSNHEYFNFRSLSFRQIASVIILTITLVAIIAATIIFSISDHYVSIKPVYSVLEDSPSFDDNWYNSERILIDSIDDTHIGGKKEVVYHKTIPSNCNDNYTISFSLRNLYCKAFVDLNSNGVEDEGEEVKVSEYYNGRSKYRSVAYYFISIDSTHANHDIYVKIINESDFYGAIFEVNYGTESGVFYSRYVLLLFQFYLAIVLFLFSLALSVISFLDPEAKKSTPQLFFISMFAVSISLYILFSCGVFQIATGNAIIFDTVSLMMLVLAGWFFATYLYLRSANMVILRISRILLWLLTFDAVSILITVFVPQFELFYCYLTAILFMAATTFLSFINSLIERKIKGKNISSVVYVVQNSIFLTSIFIAIVFQALHNFGMSVSFLEVGSIIITAVALVSEFRNSVLKTKEVSVKQKEENDTKVAIMLAQIQPHFLYNTLNSIAILCDMDPKQARDLTVKFSQYLRNNIDSLNKSTPIAFATELSYINNYLSIEKIRFSNKLKVVENIQVQDFYVPVLTIQPLVENAVKHGISKKATPGVLMITTSQDNNNYYVIIEDDGVGFDTSIIDIKSKLGKSIGFSNVKYRLESMIHGKVDISSIVGKGTKVIVTLPKIYNNPTQE